LQNLFCQDVAAIQVSEESALNLSVELMDDDDVPVTLLLEYEMSS
jgi:hypothetical protein